MNDVPARHCPGLPFAARDGLRWTNPVAGGQAIGVWPVNVATVCGALRETAPAVVADHRASFRRQNAGPAAVCRPTR